VWVAWPLCLILTVMFHQNNQHSLLSFLLPQAIHTKGLASTIQCVLISQTFEGQYFKCMYVARANTMYKTAWPVVCLDVFSREREREREIRTGIEPGTFPDINRRPRWFSWSVLFTMSKVRSAQLDTTVKDKSHRHTGPILLSEPALF
jgi:hypothetical protein